MSEHYVEGCNCTICTTERDRRHRVKVSRETAKGALDLLEEAYDKLAVAAEVAGAYGQHDYYRAMEKLQELHSDLKSRGLI